MAAIKTFCECVAGGAYAYMNFKAFFADDIDLLAQAYKHYVHFTWVATYTREQGEQGRRDRDERRKVLQMACERVSKS
jgi:hypothetical protein